MLSCAQEESYTAEDAGTFELPDREQSGRPADVLERLEAATEDRRRGLEGAERIAKLLKDAEAKFSDDYTMNKALRRRLRCALRLYWGPSTAVLPGFLSMTAHRCSAAGAATGALWLVP